MNGPVVLLLGAALMFASVAAGAFGAHVLRGMLSPELLAVYQTAVQYQAWHALGLVAIGIQLDRWPRARGLGAAACALLVGIALFSGSLYLYVVTGGVRAFAMITPLGGIAFLVGWGIFVVTAWRGRGAHRGSLARAAGRDDGGPPGP